MTEDGIINTEMPDGAAAMAEMPSQPAVSTDEVQALSDDVEPAVDEQENDSAEDVRSQLMRQFEQWLDDMLAGESAPPVPGELIAEALAESETDEPSASSTDLYTLFAAVTKLSGEIGLQGRSFKQLTDSLLPLAQVPGAIESMEEAQCAAGRQFDRLAEQLTPKGDDASLPPTKEVLAVLFDLLERLERGLKTFEDGIASIAKSRPNGLFARMAGAQRAVDDTMAMVQAMRDGYRLTLARLQASLEQWNIQRIGHAGDSFDPATMTAIEIDATGAHPDGTVAEVLRSGYSYHGKLLAPAQVKVARR